MNVYEEIVDRVYRRARAWLTIFTDALPSPARFREWIVLGRYGITAEQTHRRVLLESALIRVDSWKETPAALARDYLRIAYPKWKPERWAVRWPRRWWPPHPYSPQYARPATYCQGVYLDIRRMWWTILKRWGWDCLYLPGRYLGQGRPPHEWPWPDHKEGRNALVSSAFPVEFTRLYPPTGEQQRVRRDNDHLHIPLVHLVSDIMHYLAALAVQEGAVYVHTDGIIAPNLQVAERLKAIIADHGFDVRVKARGWGWVRGPGSFRVGYLVSKIPATDQKEYDGIRPLDPSERRLLRKHLRR